MENIIEPNETFDFSKLSLAHPIGIQGGAYFTKIEHNKKPLYIQTTKGQSRQGFVKTGKKYYIDLMFDKNSESLIQWFENLEAKCQSLIFERRDTWFQNGLEESDIETAFNSTIRVYKSGKFYLLRTNIKNNHNNLPAVKIYNEQQVPLTISDVTNETNTISILEIQGIKFTTRNFQIEIELKQMMVLDNEPLFDSCLIKTSRQENSTMPVKTNEVPLVEEIATNDLLETNTTSDNNIVVDIPDLIDDQNMDDLE
jgi:LEA14-like dessication related protein